MCPLRPLMLTTCKRLKVNTSSTLCWTKPPPFSACEPWMTWRRCFWRCWAATSFRSDTTYSDRWAATFAPPPDALPRWPPPLLPPPVSSWWGWTSRRICTRSWRRRTRPDAFPPPASLSARRSETPPTFRPAPFLLSFQLPKHRSHRCPVWQTGKKNQ